MKQEIQNRNRQERRTYVPATIKVIEVTAQRVMCTSTIDSTQNESYGNGDTSGWF